MKKTICVLILILGIISGVFGQTSGPMDLVVLLDTSASMSNSYRETSDYVIGPFLKEFLRIGDTFHLVSFAETPRVEISRRIEGVGDVETVVGRLLLMYPLDSRSDVAGALSFGERYASSLPGTRHRKLVLITDGDAPDTQSLVNAASSRLGGQNADLQYIKVPVAGSGPSSGRPAPVARVSPAAPAAQSRQPSGPVQSSPAATRPQTPVQPQTQAVPRPQAQTPPPAVTQTPGAARPQAPVQSSPPARQPGTSSVSPPPSRPSVSGPASSTTPAQVPPPGVSSPSPAGTAPDTRVPPAGQGTPSPSGGAATPSVPGVPGGQTTPPRGATVTPSTTPPAGSSGQPPSGTAVTPRTPSEPARAVPPAEAPARTVAPESRSQESASFFSEGIPLPLIIALIILALLILGLIIFFAARNLHSSPNRVMAQAAAPVDYSDRVEAQRQDQIRGAEMMGSYAAAQRDQQRKPLPKDRAYDPAEDEGPLMLNLFVEDQNTAIGRRNIHTVKQGYTFSVGGGKSDFLIFLVPVPSHIADVVFDGRNCTFIPRKPQYFPDIGSQQVAACIGKTIRVISDKNYELFIRIDRYQDPLKALNKMLHSISVPGEVRE